MYNQGLKSISNYRLNNELSLLTEKFQYDRWNAIDKVVGEKQINQEYLITPDAGNLVDDTELFSSMPFDLTTDGKNIRPKTYDDYQIINNQLSTIDATTGQPTEYTRPKIMNSSKEVYENISKWVKDTGSSEYINETTTTNLFNSINAASAKTATTNQQQLNDVVMNIWDKITPEDRYYVLNNTIKQGVMMKLPGDTENKYYTGTQALSYIEEQRIKYNNAYKKYEAALTANNREEAIKYEKEADKYLKLGQQASKDVMNMAKINAIRIAQGQSIGLENMSLTLGETQSGLFGEFGELSNEKEASIAMQTYSTKIPELQNVYMEDLVKNGNKTELTTSLKWLNGQNGAAQSMKFIIGAEAQNLFANKLFGAENNYKLEAENIPISKLPNNWLMNGVYAYKDILGDEAGDLVHVKNIGGLGYFLPKFHTPEEGKLYSIEVQKKKNGTVIGDHYVPVIMTVKTSDASKVKLPFVEADGKTITYRTLSELSLVDKKKTSYDIKEVDGKYEFRIFTPGPNPYYGSSKIQGAGNMEYYREAQSVTEGKFEDDKRDAMYQKQQWDDLMAQSNGKLKGISFGQAFSGDNADDIFTAITTKMNEKPGLIGDRELYFEQTINNIYDSNPDKASADKLRRELKTKWDELYSKKSTFGIFVNGIYIDQSTTNSFLNK